MTKFRVPRENCQITICFMHTNTLTIHLLYQYSFLPIILALCINECLTFMNILRLYILINHIHHIIILLVYNFLAIMNKTTKIQKGFHAWRLCTMAVSVPRGSENLGRPGQRTARKVGRSGAPQHAIYCREGLSKLQEHQGLWRARKT
jgi:hypothetical protein